MDESAPEPRFLENIALFLSFRCQVACAHCSVRAGPHRTESIDEKRALDWIAQAASYGNGRIKAVNFTGGEPFINLPMLRSLVRFTASSGLYATAVTNAHWAVSPDVALETLASLPELLSVQISADDHHQRHIPFERVRNAVLAARKLGLVYAVAVCTEDELSDDHLRTMDALREFAEPARIRTYSTFPLGRALGRQPGIQELKGTPHLPIGPCGGADTPHVMPDGRVVTCVGAVDRPSGHPLVLGNLRETPLSRILDDSEANLALHLVRIWGPARLEETLRVQGAICRAPGFDPQGDQCALCLHLMARPAIRGALARLAEEEDLQQRVAYGRLYYFNEDQMLRQFGIA